MHAVMAAVMAMFMAMSLVAVGPIRNENQQSKLLIWHQPMQIPL